MPTEIDSLQIKIESQSNGAAQGIDALVASLNKLKNVPSVTKVKNRLNTLSTTLKTFESSSAGIKLISELATAMIKIAKVGELKGLNSSLKTLTKMPKTVDKAVNSMNKYSKSASSAAPATEKLAATLASMKVKFAGITYVAHKAFSVIGGWVNSINDYVENVNLFTVAMGEYADEAMEYAETVHDALGVDVSEFIRNQGIFMSMAKGFGLATDAAYEMSKGLTELSYDLASFYNISLDAAGDGAFAKVQSGIAGELEPLRRLGFALSEASLQQVAYNHGIDLSVREMTEAQKATLRYTAMVEQAADMGVIGDMSRTVTTSANAMRILKQQLAELGRSLGSVFLPIIMKVLPYLQAFVKVLSSAAQAAANFFGFTLPTIDYSDVTGLESELEDATEDAKALKKALIGIDELNVLDNNDSDKNSSGNSFGSDLGIDIESIWNKSIFANINNQVDELVPKMENLWEIVKLIGTAIISWKVADKVSDFFKLFTDKNLTFAKTAGLAISLTGLTLSFSGSFDIGKGDVNTTSVIKTALGAVLGIGGSLLTFGTGPLGWSIGIGATLAVSLTGLAFGMSAKFKENVQKELDDRFGNWAMTSADINEYVATLTTSDVTMKIDLYVEQQELVEQAKTKLTEALSTLETLNIKAQMGLEVSEESYNTAVENLIASSNAYFEEKMISYTISVDVLLKGTDAGDSLSEFATSFLTTNQMQLNSLGEDLKDVVSNGFVDGEWIPDKLEEAIKLQKEIEQVLSYISDTEFKAKMKALELDAGEVEMTLESYNEIRDRASAAISEQLSNLEEIRLENLQLAQMQFDQNILDDMSYEQAQKIYNDMVTAIQENFRTQSAEIQLTAFSFNIDTVMSGFSEVVSQAEPLVTQSVTDMLNDTFYYTFLEYEENPYEFANALVQELQWQLENEFSMIDMDKTTRTALEKLYKALAPDIVKMEELAKSYTDAGKAVPENIAQGLMDAHTIGAMLGELDSIYYLVGQKLSTDTEYLKTLTDSEGVGKNIDDSIAQGLIDNLQLVTDKSTGVVTAIKNAITGEVVAITPELEQNLNDMGMNLSDGLYGGWESKLKDLANKFLDSALWPWNWFKEANDINSPSKVFEEGGEFIAEGLYNGVSNTLTKESFIDVFGRIKEAFTSTWDKITTWFGQNVKPKLTTEYWANVFSGVKDGFVEGIKSALNIGIEKLNSFISSMNSKLSFTIPGFTIFGGASFDFMGKEISIPSIGWGSKSVSLLNIPQITQRFANGGFIEDGLFTMNQGEIAGKFNNGKSVVANNEQIIDGISDGVYRAVVAAMGASGSKDNQNVNVYLDGKQIYSSVKKTESERGKQIFGNQLGYGY